MSILGVGAGAVGGTGFYPETIGQSLRFEDGDSPYLDRTPSSETDRDKFTWSCWIKRGVLDQLLVIFQHGPSNNNSTGLFLETDNTLVYQHADGGGATDKVQTNAKLRDITGFYHIALAVDTTQSTDSNRVRLYINGVYQSSLATANYPTQNTDTDMNTTNKFRISGQTAGTQFPFDGYMAEVNFLDGIQVGDTQDSNGDYILDEFGETKNGVWIPKAYSGSYGTNGFRLTFADSSSLGDDTSGNGNDFTSSGLASTDVVIDTPTNNFCTTNPLQKGAYITLSEGNLKVAGNNATNSAVTLGTFAQTSGKWYFEVRQGTVASEFIGVMVKQVSFENSLIDGSNVAQTQGKGVVIRYNGDVRGISGELQSVSAFTYTAGDIIGIAFDMDNGAVYFAKNNTWLNSGDPTSGSSKTGSFLNFTVDDTRIATPALDSYTGGFVTGNFGQDSSFAGTETAQGNTDGNGQGDFYYTPPSGYLALCSSNLTDTTLSPNQSEQATDYFNTVLYTGDNSTDLAVTGVGFQADWLWFKARNIASNHRLFDTSRGMSSGNQELVTNNSDAEGASNSAGINPTADGFTFDVSVGGTNEPNFTSNYVTWCWKASGSGTTSSNTNGTITSTVQASTDAGFSIVTYTGTGTAGTIGHGLGSKPSHIIVKARSHGSTSWTNYHGTLGAGKYLALQSTQAVNSGTNTDRWNNTEPTDSVFSVGTHVAVNNSSSYTYVAYVFAEIEGYSKFGSYTGNGSTDGTFVYTGFRPAWVMLKSTSASNWFIFDNKRNTFNVATTPLFANSSGAEEGTLYPIDFLASGFKLKASSGLGTNESATYIYMAFAEQPFKFSNAR